MAREDDRKMAAKKQHQEAEKFLDDQARDRESNNRVAMERAENSQPTPTQRENDLAKLGVPVPDKEDDGSGPDVKARPTVAGAPGAPHPAHPATPVHNPETKKP